MRNLAEGTERDVVRFFAKRIKCGCLKRRSRKIKNEPKLGLCIHCESRKKRHELMVCSLCRKPQYCSMKCQHAHWPKHKVYCASLRSCGSKKEEDNADDDNNKAEAEEL